MTNGPALPFQSTPSQQLPFRSVPSVPGRVRIPPARVSSPVAAFVGLSRRRFRSTTHGRTTKYRPSKIDDPNDALFLVPPITPVRRLPALRTLRAKATNAPVSSGGTIAFVSQNMPPVQTKGEFKVF